MRLSVAFIFLVVLTSFNKNVKAQQISLVSPAGTKFLLYTPPGYNPATTTYPLLVYLHGGGEIGDDLNLITDFGVYHHCPAWIIKNTIWPASRSYVIVTPQLKRDPLVDVPNNQVWPTSVVKEVIDHVKSLYRIDNSKMYLTGISLGAAGCWDYAATYPSEVAGLVPFSGNTDVTKACLLKDIPIWAFHGELDQLVLPQMSISMVNAINACAEPKAYKPQLNILYAELHGGWSGVYEGLSGYLIFDWLLQFSKNDFSNKPPYVNAGLDRRMLLRTGSITLNSEYFDTDGSVAQIQWTQTSGSALTLENTNKKFLRLKNLVAGTFEFQVTATDNLGLQSSDRVVLNILNSVPGSESAVNKIQLYNGNTNQLVKDLYDDVVININTMGTPPSMNIKAICNANTGSLKFKVNNQQASEGARQFFIFPQGSGSEWKATVGEYLVCGTPFVSPWLGGNTGIWDCYKISVYNQPVVNYYLKPGGDISNLNSWGININGTGTAPSSFTANFQLFNIQTTGILNSALQMDGVESFFWVRSGGILTLNNQFSGLTINAEANSTINVNTDQPITFGTLSPSSSVNFNAAYTLIPSASYGNVSLTGTNTVKTLSNGTTVIAGNLTIDDKVILNGGTASIIELGGNLNINETNSFLPATPFSLKLSSASLQAINFISNRLALAELIIQGNKTVDLNGSPGTVIELGSLTGGGLSINANNTLNVNKTTLSIVGGGALNGNGETGKISIDKGTIKLKSNANKASNLYFTVGADSLRTLSADLSGGGSLLVRSPVHIVDSVKSYNGTIFSAGNIRLISTGVSNATASIARIEGTGFIDGPIQWQRFIDGEKSYKYLSFPLTGISVSNVQNFLPITGVFEGSTIGYPTTPSLYQYDEVGGGWRSFPNLTNQETFQIGRGYSLYMRNATDVKLILSGGIQQGNFPFSLIPNVSGAINLGWNLLGNPYASSILWGGPGWNATGVSSAIYIRDNSYPGGKYFVWDGVTGDEEFSGVITPGQSFWTRVTNGSPTLTIRENAKHGAASGTLFRTKETEVNSMVLSIILRKNELQDKAYLKLNQNASTSFDHQFDAVKKYNGFFNISTLTSDSVEVAINNLSTEFCNTKIPLSIAATESGNYSLSFSGNLLNQEIGAIYLIDSFKQDTINVDQSTSYAFSITEDNIEKIKNRFHILQQTENPVVELIETTLSSSYNNGNQWLLNGEEIAGETNSNFNPEITGSYQVRVQNSTCTLLSDPINFIVTDVARRLNGIKIYPNPTSRYLYIEGLDNSSARYSILNALGVTLQDGTLENKHPLNENPIEIDLNKCASGVYLINLFTKKSTLVHRFIIQPH